ncbi:MAG TPA: GntR family transcriptional regulator [Gemmatimonadales bacterium]|nr:GntR family transcriptional regulator [Gemmatimonadales bacterium]
MGTRPATPPLTGVGIRLVYAYTNTLEAPVFFRLDPRSPVPLYAQVADQLRVAIVARELPAGSPLDSVRALAGRLRINPATVVQAYRQLEAEGFVEMRHGSGTYVRDIGAELRTRTQESQARDLVRALIEEAGKRGIRPDALRVAFDKLTRERTP